MNIDELIAEAARRGVPLIIVDNRTYNIAGYNVAIGNTVNNNQGEQRRLLPASPGRSYPNYYTPEMIDSWEREYTARDVRARELDYIEAQRAAQEAQDKADYERRLYEALNMSGNHRRR